MGLLVDGVWRDDSFDKARMEGGRFNRPTTKFRNWVTPDGSPGPSGEGGFAAETGRYHLYVSLACPWAHRTIIFRQLKGLENVISMSVTSWHMGENGWTFDKEEGSSGDALNGTQRLSEIYLLADPQYTGRVTVPVLWDKKRKTIVSNESSEIIRMLNSAFDALHQRTRRLLSAGAAQRDRRRQRARLSERQQRRLSRRLRHRAGGLRGSVPQRVRRARRAGAPPVTAALSRRRPHDRSRLAAVPHADPLRRGLLQPLQMQPAAHRRLPEPVELSRATSTRCRASTRP